MKPIILQPKNSQLCGPACLQMVLESMSGESFLMETIAKALEIDNNYGIGLFDLALYPASHGFQVDLFAWDAQNFPISWRDISQKKLWQELEKLKPKKQSWHDALLKNLKAGSKFHATPISVLEIKKRLKRGERMIMYIDSAVLYRHADGVWGHYVVVKKILNDSVTILDPHWKFGGQKSYSLHSMLFAFYSVGGYSLFISKKGTRPRH